MSNILSPHVRNVLSRSLPMVRQHKDELIEKMERSLRVSGDADPRVSQGIAIGLVEMLLDQAHSLTASGLPRPARPGDDHSALDIEGRHCSRFGDALVPALSDLLGPNVPREVPTAWCDAFWTILRDRKAAARKRAFA